MVAGDWRLSVGAASSLGRLRARIDFGAGNPGSAWMRYDTPYDATFTNTAGRLAWSYTCASTWDCGNGAQVTRQAFGYNADGALVRKVAWWDGLPGSYGVQRTLRNDGRELSTTWLGVAGAPAVSTWYDSAGRPVQLYETWPDNSELWRAESNGAPAGAYDALGRLADARLDGDHAQALASFSTYSGLLTGLASRRRTDTGGSFTDDLYHATWFAHEGARVTGFTEVVSGMQHGYGYDDSGRLTSAGAAFVVLADSTRAGLVPPFSEAYAFAPDAEASPNAAPWNLTRVTTASAAATYGYDANAPEQLAAIGYSAGSTVQDVVSSDARGLVTEVWSQPGNDTVQLGYDAAVRLTTIGHNGTAEETLTYDASGQVAKRVLSGETRYYLDEALTIVVNAGATTQWVHVSANGERVVSLPQRESGSYPAVYYHRDQLGSVVATTTAGGNVEALYRYGPYGNTVVTTGETAQNASEPGYTGGLKLSEGLLHLQARAYWPRLRRFVQPDNLDRRRFSYVGGDPTNLVDPSGHFVSNSWNTPTICIDGLCGIYGGNTVGGAGGSPFGGAFTGGYSSSVPGTPRADSWFIGPDGIRSGWNRGTPTSFGSGWNFIPGGEVANCADDRCWLLPGRTQTGNPYSLRGGLWVWVDYGAAELASAQADKTDLGVQAWLALGDGLANGGFQLLKGLVKAGVGRLAEGVASSLVGREEGVGAVTVAERLSQAADRTPLLEIFAPTDQFQTYTIAEGRAIITGVIPYSEVPYGALIQPPFGGNTAIKGAVYSGVMTVTGGAFGDLMHLVVR